MEASKTFVDSKARQYMVLQTEMVRLKREEKALIQFYEKLTGMLLHALYCTTIY